MKKIVPILVVISIMFLITGCNKKRTPLVSLETYELHCRNLNNNELIAEFYRG